MKFRPRPLIVEAEQLTEAHTIHTLSVTWHLMPGDWLVTGLRGRRYPVPEDVFHEMYEPVEPEAPRT